MTKAERIADMEAAFKAGARWGISRSELVEENLKKEARLWSEVRQETVKPGMVR